MDKPEHLSPLRCQNSSDAPVLPPGLRNVRLGDGRAGSRAVARGGLWGSYLDQPGLQPVVHDDVVAVALKAVLVVVHHRLQGEGPASEGPARPASWRRGTLCTAVTCCVSLLGPAGPHLHPQHLLPSSLPFSLPPFPPWIPLQGSEVDAFLNLGKGFRKQPLVPPGLTRQRLDD